MPHRNGLALGPTQGTARGKMWRLHKLSGGSRGLTAGAISQLCSLQQDVWEAYFHGCHPSFNVKVVGMYHFT